MSLFVWPIPSSLFSVSPGSILIILTYTVRVYFRDDIYDEQATEVLFVINIEEACTDYQTSGMMACNSKQH